MDKTEKEIQEEILEGWAILDENTVSENDFLFWANDLDARLKTLKPDAFNISYNQAAQRRTRNWCTNYMAFSAISDMLWITFTLEEILEIHLLAEKKYGWGESWWNYLYKAVDCVRDYYNAKNPDNQLISYRIDLLSKEAQTLFDAWKTIMLWYRTTSEHYQDSQDNWKLDSASFKNAKRIWWHAIRKNKDQNRDNYIGTKKFNDYQNENLVQYVREWTYFRYGYVFFEKEESIFADVPKNHTFYDAIKWAKENDLVNGFDDWTFRPGKELQRDQFVAILKRYHEKFMK